MVKKNFPAKTVIDLEIIKLQYDEANKNGEKLFEVLSFGKNINNNWMMYPCAKKNEETCEDRFCYSDILIKKRVDSNRWKTLPLKIEVLAVRRGEIVKEAFKKENIQIEKKTFIIYDNVVRQLEQEGVFANCPKIRIRY